MTKREIFLSVILGVIGVAVWVVIGLISKEVEAWDNGSYFIIGLPIMFAASGIAGFIEPGRPWRWGIIVFIVQPITLFIQLKGDPLVFVSLFFFIFFIVLAIGCAYLGRTIRRNQSEWN